MSSAPFSLPSDLASAQAALLTEREARLRSEAERDAAVADAANARARLSSTEALIALNTSELWPSQGFNLAAILVQNA